MYSIIFVGSNPSTAATSINPFDPSTKSSQTLFTWLNQANIQNPIFLNVANQVTPHNRALTTREIKNNLSRLHLEIDVHRVLNDVRIVAVGKTAEKALTLLRLPFFSLPHPSGLNRQLNDPNFIEEKIKGLTLWVNP